MIRTIELNKIFIYFCHFFGWYKSLVTAPGPEPKISPNQPPQQWDIPISLQKKGSAGSPRPPEKSVAHCPAYGGAHLDRPARSSSPNYDCYKFATREEVREPALFLPLRDLRAPITALIN